jgi:hypothetical protein
LSPDADPASPPIDTYSGGGTTIHTDSRTATTYANSASRGGVSLNTMLVCSAINSGLALRAAINASSSASLGCAIYSYSGACASGDHRTRRIIRRYVSVGNAKRRTRRRISDSHFPTFCDTHALCGAGPEIQSKSIWRTSSLSRRDSCTRRAASSVRTIIMNISETQSGVRSTIVSVATEEASVVFVSSVYNDRIASLNTGTKESTCACGNTTFHTDTYSASARKRITSSDAEFFLDGQAAVLIAIRASRRLWNSTLGYSSENCTSDPSSGRRHCGRPEKTPPICRFYC